MWRDRCPANGPLIVGVGRAGRAARIAGLALLGSLVVGVLPGTSPVTVSAASGVGLGPTVHRPVPTEWQDLWLVPEPPDKPGPIAAALAEAVRRLEQRDAAGALAALRPAKGTALDAFVHLTAARALLQLERRAEARERLEAALAVTGDRAVRVAALVARAELAETSSDPGTALGFYQQAFAARPAAPDAVLAGILRTSTAAGDVAGQHAAALALHYEFPASPHAAAAAPVVAALRTSASPARAAELDARELARADRLFDARRYAEARTAYLAARQAATGADAVKAAVRAAVADYHLDRYRAAADALAALRDEAPHAAEARYFHLRSLRALGQRDAYVAAVRDLADRHPASPWAAEALNHLASYFIVDDQDDRALEVFARVLDQHPAHRHAERAAWRLGWARYRQGRFAEAAATFERGAANAPRSDYRPAWLYWSGRAYERAGDRDRAAQRLRVAVLDYQNSYYGRLSATALKRLGPAAGPAAGPGAAATGAVQAPTSAVPEAHRDLVRLLLTAGLLDFAAAEVEFAQRAWGNAASLEATLAWIHHRRGDLRRGITLMRRAYPQFLAAGGERLPAALQRVIFPVAYGPLLDRYARQRDLDPYLVAALVAQESSFQPDARSVANALGLMQIMPATGRRLARTEGVRRFSTGRLVEPELNVRLGTRYFAGLVDTLGGEHLALASYNAGKSRVDRWLAERPGLPRDEFIDDIPFPETQNYVKRILGTAEDYRRLYGAEGLAAATASVPARSVVPTRGPARPAKVAPPAKKPAAKAPAKRPAAPRRPPRGQ